MYILLKKLTLLKKGYSLNSHNSSNFYDIFMMMCVRFNYTFVCFFCFFGLINFGVLAAEIIIAGVYRGTNLFVQNPHDGNNNYCISEVYVNNKKVEHQKATAFDIDLSSFKLNDVVNIRIIHGDYCTPKVMNMSAIKIREDFQFTSTEATETKLIWTTKGERKFGQYFLEIFKNNGWVVEKVMNCKAQVGNNIYEANTLHNSGTNKYRIKYLEISGKSSYSPEVVYISDEEKVSFYPKSVTENITFSKNVKYEVLDIYYNVVMRGSGVVLDCTGLKLGTYYLVFDNRTEKFLKKQ